MLLDVGFQRLVVEAKIRAFGVEIFFFQVITVVAVEVTNRPDGLDHDLKFARRGFQVNASSDLFGEGGCFDGRGRLPLADSTEKMAGCHHLSE